MKTTSYQDLTRNLASLIDGVVDDHEPVVIVRGEGQGAAVLMSLEDYASHEETRYLLQSPVNAERLLGSIEDLMSGRGIEKTLGD